MTCGDAVEPPIGIEPMTYSLRAKTKPSIEVRGARAPLGGGSNDAVSSDRIRATVSKLLARTLGDSVSRVASLAHGRSAGGIADDESLGDAGRGVRRLCDAS